ncbi:hypothetical protein BSK33_18335 [Geobacillus sp. 44B]|jgi:hypothetical protein|nr:hypothetical protein BSK33_18335 [Geobacillus sp. 44B]
MDNSKAFLFVCLLSEGIQMKMKGLLNKQQKRKWTQLKQKNEKRTLNELLDLMGVHRDTYKRVRGEVRRK